MVVKLQARELIISQQERELDQLVATVVAALGTESDVIVDITTHCTFGRWAITHENIINYLFDQATFIQDLFNKLSLESQVQVIQRSANSSFKLSIVLPTSKLNGIKSSSEKIFLQSYHMTRQIMWT